MNKDIVEYYSKRANEYELIYKFPERQDNLDKIHSLLKNEFKNFNVLDVACGTGYWTEKIASTAKSVLAFDINPEVIEVAQSKNYPFNNVEFLVSDLFILPETDQKFNALFGGFIWSHIPLEKLSVFIDNMHNRLERGSKVLFIDNLYIEGYSTPVHNTDLNGNVFQLRKLLDRTEHLVLKNFPAKKQIFEFLNNKAFNIDYMRSDYYWILKYFTI